MWVEFDCNYIQDLEFILIVSLSIVVVIWYDPLQVNSA